MKNKLITIILILILIGIFIIIGNFIFHKISSPTLISPDGKTIIQQIVGQKITPTITPTPIEFHFDKSTDLKSELNSINPEVLNSDFDDLKQITTSL